MSKLFFMQPVRDFISTGKFFRTGFGWILRVLAVALLFGGFYLFIESWKAVEYLKFWGIIGLIIAQGFFVVAVWIISQIVFNRANVIMELPDAHFTIIPIFSIVVKMIGEIYAAVTLMLSVVGTIMIWFSGGGMRGLYYQFREFAPFLQSGYGFWGGLLSLGIGIVSAFVLLFVFYLLAELIVVTFDIANNVRDLMNSNKNESAS